MFVTTKHICCCHKSMLVKFELLWQTHVILEAAPVNDSETESVTQSWDISMPAVLLRHGTGWVGVDNRPINTDNLDKLGCYRLACIISATLWFLSCSCFPQLSRSFVAWPWCAHNNTNNNGYLKCVTCSGPKRYTFFKGQVQGLGWFLTWFPLKFAKNNDVGEIVIWES